MNANETKLRLKDITIEDTLSYEEKRKTAIQILGKKAYTIAVGVGYSMCETDVRNGTLTSLNLIKTKNSLSSRRLI